ncbi:hypothetical protein COCSADRAFT_30901 [Bipolaris sorokiniana ND90Pr]|uniref:Cyanovirin-N domain-containing protein n=1 Tax=Cochliobolus sativus (strain ND90Pr / ATCC 201652) TaxID=665912 RepID=M2QWH1_COCSN|nr:uncharacterized protein COCSADRAFT_30901 [Bipolaris sorokiniana ND90Pr]EMD59454.1 hypothetical protein COCSADRAFT_30901 [Bipolaris sorokiniana ND90Pr]
MNLTFPVIFSSLFLSTSAICCLFNPQPSGCPFTCKKVKTNCKCCYGPELSTSRNQCKNDYRDWCLSYEDPPGVTGACHVNSTNGREDGVWVSSSCVLANCSAHTHHSTAILKLSCSGVFHKSLRFSAEGQYAIRGILLDALKLVHVHSSGI